MRDFYDDGDMMRFVNHLRFFRRLGILVVIPMVCVITWVVGAEAQTAGGDGHALDSNQSKTQGRTNGLKKRFLLNNINNAIVTGNVAGGKGFRGNLGYTAAGDFRGQAGSDDLFSFSADSYLPGLVFERTNLLQVPSRRGMTNARYQSGLQPSMILRRSTAGVSYSPRPFSSGLNKRTRIVSDPSGSLGLVNQPNQLRRSLGDIDLQKRFFSQYRYSVSMPSAISLNHEPLNKDRLLLDRVERTGTTGALRSYLYRSGRAESLLNSEESQFGTSGPVQRSYLDLFGITSGNRVGMSAEKRGLPDTDIKRGTPNDRLDKVIEKIDEKDGEGHGG